MRFKINYHFLLVLAVLFVLAACNNEANKKDESKAAGNAVAEPATPVAAEETIDAAKVAPGLYTVLKDTMGIRLVEVNYKPGDSSAFHTHPVNAIFFISGGKAEFTLKDGSKANVELKTGISNIRAAEAHRVKNTGKTAIKVLLVEVSRKGNAATPDAATDAAKVSPDLYKVKNDTLGIRIVEAAYKPGQSSAMHFHPDNAIYVISGGKAELTTKDGNKVNIELKTGTSSIRTAEAHSVKNTGKTAIKVLLVEVYRK